MIDQMQVVVAPIRVRVRSMDRTRPGQAQCVELLAQAFQDAPSALGPDLPLVWQFGDDARLDAPVAPFACLDRVPEVGVDGDFGADNRRLAVVLFHRTVAPDVGGELLRRAGPDADQLAFSGARLLSAQPAPFAHGPVVEHKALPPVRSARPTAPDRRPGPVHADAQETLQIPPTDMAFDQQPAFVLLPCQQPAHAQAVTVFST